VKAATQTPLKDVKSSISSQLAQTKKTDTMNKWVAGLKKDYDVHYQAGYEPSVTATTGTTDTATSTTTG